MTAGTESTDLARRWDEVMMRSYGTPPVALASGSGCIVTDEDGVDYLDLIGGIAVSALGHAHPALVQAVQDQVARIAHTSNLALHRPGLDLADRLVGLLGGQWRVFFGNDGAAANECALKVARRARPDRRRFIAAEGSFHGRTMGALALTGKPAARDPFGPYGTDVTFVPYGDSEALEAAMGDDVAAVVLEPLQGEGGVVPPRPSYLASARAACDRHGALLVIDEVQSGIGRTGEWFAHTAEGIVPDVVTLAKGLGGGLPIGACLARGEVGLAVVPGDHGTTFGGNPVSCAAALVVLDTIAADGLLDHVRRLGATWQADLVAVGAERVSEVRGRGLWLGVVLPAATAAAAETVARQRGFLVNAVQPDVLRLAPPLVLTHQQAAGFTAALPGILDEAAEQTRLTP